MLDLGVEYVSQPVRDATRSVGRKLIQKYTYIKRVIAYMCYVVK